MSLSWSFSSARESFSAFAADWDRLNRALYREHPLFDSCFVGPLVEYFATDRDVLAVQRSGAEATGMALLTKQRAVWRTFLPSQTQIAPALLQNGEAAESLLRALPMTALAMDLLCLDPDYSVAVSLQSRASHESQPHATTLNIAVAGTFDAYWEGRSRGLRQHMRRALRKIEADGLTPRLEIVSEPSAVKEGLLRYGLLESAGWKAREGTAIHPDNIQGRFYERMLMGFAARGRGLIYELHIGEKLAASQIAIANDYMLITLKTTHDESLGAYSPGNVLDYLLLQHEFGRQRYAVIEYYTNASVELRRWGTGQRVVANHRVYRYPWVLPVANGVRKLKAALSRKPPEMAQAPSVDA